MNDKNEYKGIFYDDNSERKYYEGGAHFSYEALVNILKNLKNQQLLNETKSSNIKKEKIKEKEIDKENILNKAPIVSRQKNFSMKNIFSCDNPIIKNKMKKNKDNNNNNINKENNFNLKIKKINFLRNNVSKEKSQSKKKIKSKKKNMYQSNSVIQIASGQCLNININNNYNNNFININPNNNILLNNSNSNPLRILKEIISENKSGKKKPQSRNSKSKGRNYKRKNNINSSIEFNHEYNYNYNYYLVEAGLDKSAKISGNKHSGKSTGAHPSNSIHNLSINGLNNLNLTKYSESNLGILGLNCLDNSINSSKIFNKNKSGSNNKKKIIESENPIKDKNLIFFDKNININNDFYIKKNKNKGALSLDKNNKKNFNSFINKNIKINNYIKNNEVKQSVFGPIILNENNIQKLKNFNMTIFNITSNKNKNSANKDKNINFDLSNNKNDNNNKNNNNNNNIFKNNSNKNILKFANQSLLKSICLQKQNSRNIFNCSTKNKNKNVENNIPQKLSEKSCNVVGKLIEKQNNISRNSKINYDKLIKSFEG